jgi:bifunctional NMN adenylyltransferase/nudix hydrolase
MKNHKKVVIFLGVSSIVGTISNPLDFTSRKLMLQEKYPEVNIISLPDKRYDEDWYKNLDGRIREVFPIGEVLLYGGRDSFIPHYHGQFATTELEQKIYISGTEVRRQVSEEVKSSAVWRAGAIYDSFNRHPVSIQQAHTAVFNESETSMLLCKNPGEKKYSFIGGIVNPRDISLEHTARREFMDKTSTEMSIESYVGSFRLDDWKYRGERDKVMTILFKGKYIFGHLSPSYDISELAWVDVSELKKDGKIKKLIIEEHQPLMNIILTKIK